MTTGELIDRGYSWRRAGWVVRAQDGRTVRAWEALTPLHCQNCGAIIHPRERFSRALLNIAHKHRRPVCRGCLPFVEVAD